MKTKMKKLIIIKQKEYNITILFMLNEKILQISPLYILNFI